MELNYTFKIEKTSLDEFIAHWSQRYAYASEEKYTNNIGRPLTERSRLELFEWKNGSNISKRKWDSIVSNYPLNFNGDRDKRYLNHRENGGAIWNIFYLHCLDQAEYPIFDQHTYRAMKYLKTGKIEEISHTGKQKYDAYSNEYKPFFRDTLSQSLNQSDRRKLDKALFGFGQFLKCAKPYA